MNRMRDVNETKVRREERWIVELGKFFFRWRDYTPLPLILVMLFVADPSVVSATVGVIFCCIGEFLRMWCVSYIGGVSRTRSDSLGQRLVIDGPFRIVRNPLYFSNLIIILGIVIF